MASLAKWLSVRLRAKWLWVRVQLQSSQSLFVFLKFEAGLDKNTLKFSDKVLFRDKKNISCKHQSYEGIFVREKEKYIASLFFDVIILKSSLLN